MAPLVAVLALADVLLAWMMERQLSREPTASRLRVKGQTPEHSSALMGMVMMLAPVCWALFASFLGLERPLSLQGTQPYRCWALHFGGDGIGE